MPLPQHHFRCLLSFPSYPSTLLSTTSFHITSRIQLSYLDIKRRLKVGRSRHCTHRSSGWTTLWLTLTRFTYITMLSHHTCHLDMDNQLSADGHYPQIHSLNASERTDPHNKMNSIISTHLQFPSHRSPWSSKGSRRLPSVYRMLPWLIKLAADFSGPHAAPELNLQSSV